MTLSSGPWVVIGIIHEKSVDGKMKSGGRGRWGEPVGKERLGR